MRGDGLNVTDILNEIQDQKDKHEEISAKLEELRQK